MAIAGLVFKAGKWAAKKVIKRVTKRPQKRGATAKKPRKKSLKTEKRFSLEERKMTQDLGKSATVGGKTLKFPTAGRIRVMQGRPTKKRRITPVFGKAKKRQENILKNIFKRTGMKKKKGRSLPKRKGTVKRPVFSDSSTMGYRSK